jgi:hypothetical protein
MLGFEKMLFSEQTQHVDTAIAVPALLGGELADSLMQRAAGRPAAAICIEGP